MDKGVEERHKLKLVSLFSGCGGLDLGFDMFSRYDIKFASDVKADAAMTYAQNFKSRTVRSLAEPNSNGPLFFLGDIRQMDYTALKSLFPEPDIVAGGPPCQDFSIARGSDRAKAGMKTERGRLYAYFVKALIYLKPKYFVFENVPGLVSDNSGKTWDIIREDFQNLSIHVQDIERIAGDGLDGFNPGYVLAYAGVVDASAVGVPQKRHRLVVIGVRNDLVEKASGGLCSKMVTNIQELCRKKLEGDGSLLGKYPMTTIEAFEGYPLDQVQQKYGEIMDEWLMNKANKKVSALEKWAQKHEKESPKSIIESYIKVNGLNLNSQEKSYIMKQHEIVLMQLGYYGRKVCAGNFADGSCDRFNERENVIERMFYTPPGENYKFLYPYRQFRVEGKGISMIYKRIHPLKPAYTITANGGGGTHGYHYDRTMSRLTLREIARLQSFPDSFMFKGTKAEVNRQIGEAVPPLLGMRIAEAIWEIDQMIHKQLKSIRAEHA